MPPKQTRESIEAELNASESDRLASKLQEVLNEIDDVEKELKALGEARGLPAFYRSKPLLERMIESAKKALIHDHVSHSLERSFKASGSKGQAALRDFKLIAKYL